MKQLIIKQTEMKIEQNNIKYQEIKQKINTENYLKKKKI